MTAEAQRPGSGGSGGQPWGGAAEQAPQGPTQHGDAAKRLAALEERAAALASERAGLAGQLAAAAGAAYQAASARLGGAATGVPVPGDAPSLVAELAALQAARQVLSYAQELQGLTRSAEKLTREGERAAAEGDAAALLAAAGEAANAASAAQGYACAVEALVAGGRLPSERLAAYVAGLLARCARAQAALRVLLSRAIQDRLAAAHWPPPLAAAGEGPDAAAAAAAAAWDGFSAAPAAASELQHLFVALLTLQRAAQHAEFGAMAEPGAEGPLLWPAEELAAPVAAWLASHFASGLPTDRPDKPEWLFAAALGAAQACAAAAGAMQPALDAHGLQGWYHMQVEVGRAVAAVALNGVLSSHTLPALAAAGDPALWLHYADEAMRFERRAALLRGGAAALSGDEDLLPPAHAASTLDLLFRGDAAWREGWLAAEAGDASRQMEAAVEAYSAWQPAAAALGALPGDETPAAAAAPPPSRACGAEFWPPACSEQVAGMVAALLRRGGWLAAPEARLAFASSVPAALLATFRERVLSETLATAERFRELLGEAWLPRVGAAICAAHYLEHQLREPQGVLLLAELQDGVAPLDGSAPAALAVPPPVGVTALVEAEAAAFAGLRRKWSNQLAKAAVDRFKELFAPYKNDLALFASPADGGAGGPGVSPPMLVAADRLHGLLGALGSALDAVVFRDVWRAVAVTVNYAFFNEVATEAGFTEQGAAHLEADLDAVVAVFGEFTPRPAAHFKESKEACRLLRLPRDHAAHLVAALGSVAGAAPALAAAGVRVLNAQQASCVLGRRLDLAA